MGRPRSRLALALALAVPATLPAGAEERDAEAAPPRTTLFDLDHPVEDPEDLFPPERDFQNRWRSIWGALGMRYYLYPSQQTGPEHWPPHLFAGGTNYSVWRNPITGWPEF